MERLIRWIKEAWRKVIAVDWSTIILGVAGILKKSTPDVDERYLVIKPHILSDDNIMKAASAIRMIVSFVPHPATLIAGPLMGLGITGFSLWKKMAASQVYDVLEVPPADPNIIRMFFSFTPEVREHYEELAAGPNISFENLAVLEKVYNDFHFITEADILKEKYPNIDVAFLQKTAERNLRIMQKRISVMEQKVIQFSNSAESDANVREAFTLIKKVFPALNSWALFNSKSFDKIIDTIDMAV